MLIDSHSTKTENGEWQTINYILPDSISTASEAWVTPMDCNIPAAPEHVVIKRGARTFIVKPVWDEEEGDWYDRISNLIIGSPIF